MKLLRIFKCLPVFFLLFAGGCGEKNPYRDIEIPRPPKAENLRIEYSDFPFGKAIYFQKMVDFPAQDVIDFYNKSFSELGYEATEYNSESDRKWTLFSQKTLEYLEVNSKPASWIASWTDKHNKHQFVLSLNYPEQDSQYLYVICGIQPYFSTKRVDSLFERIAEAGDFEAFMELLDKYKTKGSSIDMKKALKENPKNKYLQEYNDIITGKTK